MDLRALIHDPQGGLAAIAAALDDLSPAERLAATRALGRKDQRALFAKAGPCALSDLVAADRPPRAPVRHHGLNTLPLPGFNRFEKLFCRPEDGSARLFGFNEGRSRPLIGPGYFVAHPTQGNPAWEERGAVVVDYFQVPDGPVAEGWPKVVPNSHGLQILVFHRTRDFMRKVSRHVTIGAAYKGEKALGQFFVLCREE